MTSTMSKRNILLSSGIMLALLVIGAIIWGYFTLPSNYISLDVNPSIEIQTNRLNQVVSINPVNEDAKQVMAGYQLTDKNLEVVIKNIVDRMILYGYLAPDKDNQILITTDNKNATAELEKNINVIISTYLEEKQLNANLLQQSIKVETNSIEIAHENSISAGKMALIEKLVHSDPTLTTEELSKLRISDLTALAKAKNINLDGLIDENNDNDNGNVNDGQSDINNVDEGNVNDEQSDINNVDESNVNDGQSDINNVDEGNVNDEQGDINNADEGNVNDEQSDSNNVDKPNVNDEQGDNNNNVNN